MANDFLDPVLENVNILRLPIFMIQVHSHSERDPIYKHLFTHAVCSCAWTFLVVEKRNTKGKLSPFSQYQTHPSGGGGAWALHCPESALKRDTIAEVSPRPDHTE